MVSKGRLKIVQTLFLPSISVKLRIEYLKANINYNCFWTITVCRIIKNMLPKKLGCVRSTDSNICYLPLISLIILEMFCSDWMLTFVLYWKHITCLVLKALYNVIILFGQTDRCLSSCKDHQCVSNLIALLICNRRWSLV